MERKRRTRARKPSRTRRSAVSRLHRASELLPNATTTGVSTPHSFTAPCVALYVNDHFAGSQVALSLLQKIQTSGPKEVAAFAEELQGILQRERKMLRHVLERLDSSASLTRRTLAWVGAKLAEGKMALDANGNQEFFIFEALETVSVGVEGKRRLWRALRSAAPQLVGKRALNRLERSASEQARQLEVLRMELAAPALMEAA